MVPTGDSSSSKTSSRSRSGKYDAVALSSVIDVPPDLSLLPWSPGQFHVVENYWEAAGVLAALKAGIAVESVRRPLKHTVVETHSDAARFRRAHPPTGVVGPALWQVYFGPTTLGWFDEELFVIFDTHGNTGRNPIC